MDDARATHMRLFVGVRSSPSRCGCISSTRLQPTQRRWETLTPKNGARYVIVQTGFALAHTLAVLPAPRFFVTLPLWRTTAGALKKAEIVNKKSKTRRS